MVALSQRTSSQVASMRILTSSLCALAAVSVLSVPAFAQIVAPHAPIGVGDTATIETSAEREVTIAPDRAIIVLAVETRAASAGYASQTNAKAQRSVLDTLRAIGINPSQVSTSGYSVLPNYESTSQGGSVRNGFVARNAITVRLTQLDRVGAVIDAALARGATNVGNVSFEASNTADARRAALADAAAQAKADAATLAKAMGGTLGPLIMATTQVTRPVPFQAVYSAGRAMVETPIMAGDIQVSATVFARWAFVPNPPAP
jgi:uncharacterized protein YggE